MGKYLKKFENYSAYEKEEDKFALPNVSLCADGNEVFFNRYQIRPILVGKFNVTDTSNPTKIIYPDALSGFTKIEIDGVRQENVVSSYTFNSTGEHVVKYTLSNPSKICGYAFYQCDNITSMEIPSTVKNIDSHAFYYCSGMTSCTIPDSVISIGLEAFHLCKNLARINSTTDGVFNIPNSVTYIDEFAFGNCYSVTTFNLPTGITSIGYCTFQDCSGLTSVTIPDSVINIGHDAFRACKSLTTLSIPSGVESIGYYAFYECSGLTSITFNSATPARIVVSEFGYNKFLNDTNNCPVYVPSGSVNIYKEATGWTDYADRIQAKP